MYFYFLLVLCITHFALWGEHSSSKVLYHSLDPLSVSQHLAFYDLYPDTELGKKSLTHAWKLLSGGENSEKLSLPSIDLNDIISLVIKTVDTAPSNPLTQQQLDLIERLGFSLANRKLKGHEVWSLEELLSLAPEEIDLGRGVLLNQFTQSDEIKQYEAKLDLMALQIAARLPKESSPRIKIREINRFVFEEMQFRFPPHSLYAHDIDLYTFLPSVLDSRRGVCLGVSILYLTLAQRLGLPLEIITPPGHIYVRYRDANELINIETTARGIHMPSDVYLGINNYKLEQRNLKEVIGMVFFNQASVYWGRGEYQRAVELYEKSLVYLSEDPLVRMLLAFNYLFVGKQKEGKKMLLTLKQITFDGAVSPETMPEDYLNGKVNEEGLKAVFLHVNETKASILEKQQRLQNILKKYPSFRAGLVQLAITYLQLGRTKEATKILERYHAIDTKDANVEYYLTALALERFDFLKAWDHLINTEEILAKKEHHPKALTALRHALRERSPKF